MERKTELNFSFVLIISIFFHMFIAAAFISPVFYDLAKQELFKNIMLKKTDNFKSRDIIVNINPDNKIVETSHTMLSDVDSTAKGFLTKEKGDNWLNNALNFSVKKGGGEVTESETQKKSDSSLLLSEESSVEIALFKEPLNINEQKIGEKKIKKDTAKKSENKSEIIGDAEWISIPDKKGVTLQNAIYYSNSGKFSFNTKKFNNFDYFYKMKSKIASNWFPPIIANSMMPNRVDPKTNYYTPGSTRVLMIPSQEVKLYFTLNRNGDVMDIVVLESLGNTSLNGSCIDAVRNSKTFGPVPDDIDGETIVIPFIFGYYIIY